MTRATRGRNFRSTCTRTHATIVARRPSEHLLLANSVKGDRVSETRLKQVSHTFLDVGSYSPLNSGWLSVPAIFRLAEALLWRRKIPLEALLEKESLKQAATLKSLVPTQLRSGVVGSELLAATYKPDGEDKLTDLTNNALQITASELRNKLQQQGQYAVGDGDKSEKIALRISQTASVIADILECIPVPAPVPATAQAAAQALAHTPAPAPEMVANKTVLVASALPEQLVDAATRSSNSISGQFQPFIAKDVNLLKVLSPIGLLSTIRYNYVSAPELIEGPVQQVVALAPKESIEVVTEQVSKTVREDEYEEGQEAESNKSVDTRQTNELTDMVSKSITHSINNSITGGVNGTIGVVSANVSSNTSTSDVETSSVQSTNRTVRDVTVKTSDRLKRSFKIKVKNVQELTSTNSFRRTITNPSEKIAINVAISQALRKQTVIAQHIGTQMCWQCIVERPGTTLRVGSYRPTYQDALDKGVFAPPPNASSGTKATIECTASEQRAVSGKPFAWTLKVELPLDFAYKKDSAITLISADVTHAVEGTNVGNMHTLAMSTSTGTSYSTAVAKGDGANTQSTVNNNGLSFAISGTFIKTGHAVDDHLQIKATIEYEFEGSDYKKATDLQRRIDEEAKRYERFAQRKGAEAGIETRPPRDLREEERLEITRRVLLEQFGMAAGAASEFEFINSLFDFEAMFYSLPDILASLTTGARGTEPFAFNEEYLVTKETRARFGDSLHWDRTQCDGDRARDLFLNAKFAYVRLPIRPGKELEAIAWLESNVEGCIYTGFKASAELNQIAETLVARDKHRRGVIRDAQGDMADPGDVLVDRKSTTTLANDLMSISPTLDQLYPVVDRFEITEPVEGYLYRVI